MKMADIFIYYSFIFCEHKWTYSFKKFFDVTICFICHAMKPYISIWNLFLIIIKPNISLSFIIIIIYD